MDIFYDTTMWFMAFSDACSHDFFFGAYIMYEDAIFNARNDERL